MKAYLDILQNCLDNGTWSDNRTGIPTKRISWGATFEHDMSTGFPLVTTKKVAFKSVRTELEFFIKGYTDKKWLQDRNCKIWNEWANADSWKPLYESKKQELIKKGELTPETDKKAQTDAMDETRDLGPIYGWQWRHWNGEYKWNEEMPEINYNIDKPGFDQVKHVIETAKKNPTDRRLIVNAWNPTYQEKMALPPCHVMHQILIHDGKLNLVWTQRSCDMFLGIPFNIASYAMLLMLYAKELGYKPGVLRGEWHDVHIYKNQIDQVKEQLSRKPYELPVVEIPDENWNGMLNWQAKDVKFLKDYICHEKIKAEVAR